MSCSLNIFEKQVILNQNHVDNTDVPLSEFPQISLISLSGLAQDGISEPHGVPLCSLAELKLRFLCRSDLPEVSCSSEMCFPYLFTLISSYN